MREWSGSSPNSDLHKRQFSGVNMPFLLLLGILASGALLPSIRTPSDLPEVRPEEFLLLGAVLLIAVRYRHQGHLNVDLRGTPIGLVAFTLAAGISALWGYWRLGVDPSWRDGFEYVKMAKAITLVTLASLALKRRRDLETLVQAWVWITGAVAIIAVAQAFNHVTGINEWLLQPFYYDKNYLALREGPFRRALGTLYNPNHLAFAVLPGLMLMASRQLYGKGRVWIELPIVWVASYALFLTGSRTALVAGSAGMGLIWVTVIFRRVWRGEHFSVVGGVGLVVVILLAILLLPNLAARRYREAMSVALVPQATEPASPSAQTGRPAAQMPAAAAPIGQASVLAPAHKAAYGATSAQKSATAPTGAGAAPKAVQEPGSVQQPTTLVVKLASSLGARFKLWHAVINRIEESVLFGRGPAKTETALGADNNYLLVWMRYGLLGLFIYLFAVCWPLWRVGLHIYAAPAPAGFLPEWLGLGAALLAALVTDMGGDFTSNPQLSHLFWALVGALAGALPLAPAAGEQRP